MPFSWLRSPILKLVGDILTLDESMHLATMDVQTSLPAAFAFARDFSLTYLTRLCHTPDWRCGNAVS